MKRIMGICDSDRRYLYKVYDYFEKHQISEFEVKIFDTFEDAMVFGEKQTFEILLMHEKYYEDKKDFLHTACLVLLCETIRSDFSEVPCVSKYQSMERLRKQLIHIYAETEPDNSVIQRKRENLKVLSFLALHNQEYVSSCALSVGQLLKENNKKVLYVNLQPYSGIYYMAEGSGKYDLSDLIYYAIKYEEKTMLKIECVKQKIHGLDCLPGIKDYEDLLRLSMEEWNRFLEILFHQTEYDYLLFDCDGATLGLPDLLENSHQIFLPDAKRDYEKEAERQVMTLLQKKKPETGIKDRMEYLDMQIGKAQISEMMKNKLKQED